MSFAFSATYVALWAVVLFEGLLVVAVLQQLAKLRPLLERAAGSVVVDEPSIGSAAPEFAGIEQISGGAVGVDNLAGRGGGLLFLSPDCPTCKDLVDSVGRTAQTIYLLFLPCVEAKRKTVSALRRHWHRGFRFSSTASARLRHDMAFLGFRRSSC